VSSMTQSVTTDATERQRERLAQVGYVSVHFLLVCRIASVCEDCLFLESIFTD
jgi:hypothetical protein